MALHVCTPDVSRTLFPIGCACLLALVACDDPAGRTDPGSGCVPGLVERCACTGGDGAAACGPDGALGACDCVADGVGLERDPLELADYLIDFGARAIGERVRAAVPFQNLGTELLRFDAEPVAAPFALESATVALTAGESRELGVLFAPTAETTSSTVTRVSSGERSFTVRFAGQGFTAVVACDLETIDFGWQVKGVAVDGAVTCVNRSARPLALVAGPIAGEAFTVAPVSPVPVPPGGSWTLVVTSHASRSGRLEAELPLATPGGRALGTIALAAFAMDHALGCGPASLDFAYVAPGTTARRSIVCTNVADRPFELTSLFLDPSSHARFTWSPDAPITVPGRVGDEPGSATIEVEFSPAVEDTGTRKNGILVIQTNDGTTPRMDVQLTGFTGGPVVSCSPAQVEFGVVASAMPVTRSFTCANVGTNDPSRADDRLVVTELQPTNPEFTVKVRGGLAGGYAVGETFTVDVTYAPADDGVDAASVRIVSNDTLTSPTSPYAVAVSGTGRVLPPCDFELSPANLRFGNVVPGSEATLEFAIRNRAAECLVQGLRLDPGCDPSLSLPEGPVAARILPPGGELRVPVRFAPTAWSGAPYTCEVHFDLSAEQPHQVVPVRATSMQSCGLVRPAELDFGTVKPACAIPDETVELVNTCARTLVLGDIVVGESPSDEFVVRSEAPTGTTIPPGLSVLFSLGYRPDDEGSDLGAALVYLDGEVEPLHVTLRGRQGLDASRTDRFEQDELPTDVLWVIDNAGTMGPEQAALAANAGAFLAYPTSQGREFHLGVTSTGVTAAGACPGGANGGEDGRLFPVDGSRPRILDATTPDLTANLAGNLAVGTCGAERLALDAAYRALHPPLSTSCDDPRYPQPNDGNCGFLRHDARLAVIAVTDGANGSPGTVNFYFNAMAALKGFDPELFQFHAIAGNPGTGCTTGSEVVPPADALAAMVQQSGGTFESICGGSWATKLENLSAAIFGSRSCFGLTAQPEDTNGNGAITDAEGELEVRLDGVVTPARTPEGLQVWAYRQAERAVCFDPLFVPGPGTQVELTYRRACLSW